MEASIRLQITGDIRNQLLFGRNRHTLDTELPTVRRGVRAAEFQINPFPQDGNFILRPVRVSPFLEFRRGLPIAGGRQRLKVDGILSPYQRHHGRVHREFRVKPDIKTRLGMVIEFKVTQHRHSGEHILNIQQFPPPVMADNNIRLKPQRFQGSGGFRHGVGPYQPEVKLPRARMGLFCHMPGHTVDYTAHAGNKIGVIFADKNNLVVT